ncbi:MAG: LptE family protein [Candidatus Hydrogenedentota bacterium]
MAPLLLAADCKEPEISLPSHIRSIAIPTFVNRTSRSGLELDVTQRVLNEFTASSKLAVTPNVSEADAIIMGEIYDYQRTPISWDQTNRIVQYKIKIRARVSFEDRTTGQTIWRVEDVDGITSYSQIASPPETEESGIFKAADELARDILFLVFEQRQYSEDDLLFSDKRETSGVTPGAVERRR